MPQLKNAEKALRQNKKNEARNKNYKNRIKKLTRNFNDLLKDNKHEEAKKLLPTLYKAIDKAAKKNIIHKNNAARKKSRLAKSLADTTSSQARPTEAEKSSQAK